MLNKFLQSVKQSRLIIYIFLIGLIPILFSIFHHMNQRRAITDLQSLLEIVRIESESKEKRQATNLAVRAHFKNADHFYIDKYIEPIPLLTHETESLKKILNQQYLIENEAAKKRLEALINNNRIQFSEGIVQSYPYFHETSEVLLHPIEVDRANISEILAKIEGIKIEEYTPGPSRPQLIITEFKFDKKDVGNKNEVFLLNIKLLKREFF